MTEYEFRDSVVSNGIVEAWADDYIRHDRRPAWQHHLRNTIRTKCEHLEASNGRVLHATFAGNKPQQSDVENLVLYNISTFATFGRNGIRFEHGADIPPAPSGREYPFYYRYALAPQPDSFTDWHPKRTLASFGWTDLGAFIDKKKLARVWLEIARKRDTEPSAEAPLPPWTPFALKVQIRPPQGCQRVWGESIKQIFDGVICAFQAHTDASAALPEIVNRIATTLATDPAEVEALLLDRRHAVLGDVPKLVHLRAAGVQWTPADDQCVAGELLPARPVDQHWAIQGELTEISR